MIDEKELRQSHFRSRRLAFTLLELLVVIAIMGILAGLAIPAIKNLGKSNITVSASRQLLDDIGRARQLAMSRRATVYMVFVPTNFWGNATWFGQLNSAQRNIVTNLIDKQLTGYAFVTHGSVGDQPGRHDWTYIGSWQSLPEGSFIVPSKFALPNQPCFTNGIFNPAGKPLIYGFNTNAIPFPAATNLTFNISVPCIAFNYLGQLTFDGVTMADRHEYIPLAQGSVIFATDANKTPQLSPTSPRDITENPVGNSTGISYNIIDIDPLTGRATLQHFKL